MGIRLTFFLFRHKNHIRCLGTRKKCRAEALVISTLQMFSSRNKKIVHTFGSKKVSSAIIIIITTY